MAHKTTTGMRECVFLLLLTLNLSFQDILSLSFVMLLVMGPYFSRRGTDVMSTLVRVPLLSLNTRYWSQLPHYPSNANGAKPTPFLGNYYACLVPDGSFPL